jgi:hypothetical protein
MSSGGGKGGGGSTSTPEGRQLSGIAGRFEQEARPSRNLALNQLAGILSGGVDWLGPSMGGRSPTGGGERGTGQDPNAGPAGPRMLTRSDVVSAYSLFDIGKTQDVDRLLGGLPESFTLEDLKTKADTSGLSGRSLSAWNSVLGELGTAGSQTGGTGGGGAGGSFLLPIAQTAIENSRQSTARNMRAIDEQMASMKAGGTPFAMNLKNQARMTGEQATSQIPSRIIEQFTTNVLPLAFGQSPTVIGGLSNAASNAAGMQQGNQAAGSAQAAQNAQMYQALASAIAQAAIAAT